jgi:putative MATE family efflux protein
VKQHVKHSIFGPLRFYRHALSIALPVMAQMLIQSMVSLIDNFMVAGLGDVSMAAVNVTNQINFIFIVVVNTVNGAGGIYIAQFRGAKDIEGMRQAYRFKVIFELGATVVYFTLCWTMPEKLLGLMAAGNAARDEIITIGASYMRLCSFTLLPLALSTAIGGSFRDIGLPKIPLCISVGATLVNTAGNWLLIYGNLGAPALGVTGAAIATIIARFCELAAFLVYVRVTDKAPFFVPLLRLFPADLTFIMTILRKSLMIFLSEASWVSSETIMVALYNGRGGAEVVAGMAAGWTIANVFFLTFAGVWTTAAVIVGGTLGEGRLAEARLRAGWIISGSAVLGLIIALAGAVMQALVIPIVFSNLTEAARAICSGLVFVILIYLPLWTALNAIFAITRSGGDTASGMICDLSVNTALFVPGAFLLAFLTALPPVTMFAILKITDLVKILIAYRLYKREKWVKNLAAARVSR